MTEEDTIISKMTRIIITMVVIIIPDTRLGIMEGITDMVTEDIVMEPAGTVDTAEEAVEMGDAVAEMAVVEEAAVAVIK